MPVIPALGGRGDGELQNQEDQGFMAGLDYTVISEASLGFLFLNTNCKKTQKTLWS